MPTITIIMTDGSEKKIKADEGWSLMEICRDNGIEAIEGACGGSMSCATCHMYIHPDWADKIATLGYEKTDGEEDTMDQGFDVRDISRLGCQIRMSKDLDGLTIALPGAKVDW